MSMHGIDLEGTPEAVLVAFRGVEEISRLFRFQAFVRTPPGVSLDAAALLGKRATLWLTHAEAPDLVQRWHGVVRALRLLEATGPEEGRLWQVTIVPAVHPRLAVSRHSRVFTGKDLAGLLDDLLPRAGLSVGTDVRVSLSGSYETEEQITQYRESDLDFLSRWLEHHGVRFHFEHGDDAAVLVITDGTSHPTLRARPVLYRGGGADADASAGESLRLWRGARRTRPSAVEVDDFDYGTPTLVSPERRTVSRDGLGLVRIFGERAVTQAYAGPTAERRAHLWAAGAASFEGAGDVAGVRAGYSIEVAEHPREAMNGEFLVVRTEIEVRESALSPQLSRSLGLTLGGSRLHEVRFYAVRAAEPFRPRLAAPRPRALGVERAIVDGPGGGDYAQLDDQGRYRVLFDFDEGDCVAGKASVAVRMLQMHAGNPEGMHFPLRKGTAVVVAFLGGDPDRPAIVGAVPDAHHPSPVTRSNATQNVIQTGGETRIELEDQSESQYIVLSTPPQTTRWHMGKPHESPFSGTFTHHFVETTDGNCLFTFGGDQDVNVGGELSEIVEGSVTEIYETSLTTEITGPQTTHVTGPVMELYNATQSTTVADLVTETYESVMLTSVSGARTETYVGGQTTDVSSFVIELYAGAQTKEVGGAVEETYDGPLLQTVAGAVTQTFAAPVKIDQGPTVLIQPSVTWNVAGSITVNTPSWTEVVSVRGLNAAVRDAVATSETKVNGISLGLNLIKTESHGATAEFNVFKAEVTGPNVLFTGAHLKVHGLKVDTRAATQTKVAGFTKINP